MILGDPEVQEGGGQAEAKFQVPMVRVVGTVGM